MKGSANLFTLIPLVDYSSEHTKEIEESNESMGKTTNYESYWLQV